MSGPVATVVVTPPDLTLDAGQSQRLAVTLMDAQGTAVVLFCNADDAPRIAMAMSVRFRVIAPCIAGELGEQGLADILSVLVEGLGLSKPAVLLVGRFSEFAAAAHRETERLDQVEALPDVPDADGLAVLMKRLGVR